MSRCNHRWAALVLGLPALLGPVAVSYGQASFAENFDNNGSVIGCDDGPAGLIARGWVFRDQSQSGCRAWRNGETHFAPQAGSGYLVADAAPYSGPTAVWAILPTVPNQVAGDLITLWVVNDAPGCTFEVRYSPTGGTGTGSAPTDVGDFSVVLLQQGQMQRQWGLRTLSVPVPGSGRIALRQYVPVYDGPSHEATYVDSLIVGVEPTPGCEQYPPVPAPGQTVTWAAANSPYRVCVDTVIPAGATVLVEPGVTVNIDPDSDLTVEGTLLAQGVAGNAVTFNGNDQFDDFGWVLVRGRAEFAHTTINCPVLWPNPGVGTTVIVRDSTIRADQTGALGFTSPQITPFPPTVIVERTQVIGNGNAADTAYRFYFPACHARLTDVTISGCGTDLDGYVILQNVISTGAPQHGIGAGQRVRNLYVNGVTVTGADVEALALSTTRHAFLGADNVLQGCEYAVAANSLLPGSVVPPSGNTFNHVLADGATQLESDRLWTEVGVPWGWNAPNYANGNLTISPGVTVLMYPDMFMVNQGGRISAEGTPDAPIIFTPLSAPWQRIEELASRGSRYDHCILEGAAGYTLVAFQAVVHADSTLFRSNTVGAATASGGTLRTRKCIFTANGTGLVGNTYSGVLDLDTPDAPSAIEGNGVGIEIPGITTFVPVFDARHVWWGHPTGPAAPHNPGGQGDSIVGFNAGLVQVFPFRTGRPDFTNHPPVLRVPDEPTPLLETGRKVILRWTATDADTIVSQRVLFSERNNYDAAFVVVADGLPSEQRSYTFTVPDVPLLHTDSFIRIEAVDSLGQIGWDDFPVFITAGDTDIVSAVTSDFGGQTVRCGTDLPTITWTPVHDPFGMGATISIMLDADEQRFDLGGWFADRGYWDATRTPYASTDLARVAVSIQNNGNDSKTFYGEYFSLRPDPLLGDEPPVVTLLSPQGGAFPAGGIVPVAWTASDDESVRSFQVQASYDGGRTWHTVVKDLPGAATGYEWRLPPQADIPDVRVRVIARDLRFQSSSSTGGPFTITPSGAPCDPDFNCDGNADQEDIACIINAVAGNPGCECQDPDFNRDGNVDQEDVAALINVVAGGDCP